ncbi:MAG TPA: condensation domain-containing protein [Streptosporangiaceae bacterium]|nr:condensation domain-containing protein [Streptosporangiaceae bacterium]
MIRTRAAIGPAQASYGQQQLWLIDQINPRSREYMVPVALHLTRPLDAEAMRMAFTRLAGRHEILRTRFRLEDDGKLVQLVDPAPNVQFEFCNARGREVGTWEPVAAEQLRKLAREPFDLERGPLLRVGLTRLADDEHILAFLMHHIIFDAWSLRIIMVELSELYAALSDGRTENLEPLPIQYADFSVWQRSTEQERRFESQIIFWREHLENLTPLELPTDFPRPAFRSGNGNALNLAVDPHAFARTVNLARELRVTPYIVCLAVYQTLLGKYAGADDIVVGTPVLGRNRTEAENLIGFFVNTVVLRTDLSGDPTFIECVRRVREVCLDAFSYQDIPFTKLVDELRTGGDPSCTPLFRHTFIYNAPPLSEWKFAGSACDMLPNPLGVAKCDLSLTVSEHGAGGTVRIEYSTDLFKESTARKIGRDYLTLLQSVLEIPQAVLSAHEITALGKQGGRLHQGVI